MRFLLVYGWLLTVTQAMSDDAGQQFLRGHGGLRCSEALTARGQPSDESRGSTGALAIGEGVSPDNGVTGANTARGSGTHGRQGVDRTAAVGGRVTEHTLRG